MTVTTPALCMRCGSRKCLCDPDAAARWSRLVGLPAGPNLTNGDTMPVEFAPVDQLANLDAPPPSIELAPQQEEAVAKIRDWYTGDNPQRPVFRLFGFAGTGKTTLARHIVDQLGVHRVNFAAFTGKAAYVLRTKGCEGASTVHSLIYQPVEKTRAKVDAMRRKLRDADLLPDERQQLREAIRREERKLDSPDWILREDSELDGASLLVLDEVSMVGERMAHDLLSYNVPILCLGDPAQLPPVEGGGWFINHAPDHLLTEIHRSALDSPVTRLATAVRSSEPGQRDYGISGLDGDSGRLNRMAVDELLSFDQVLVGRNATRWQAIHLLRALRGLTGAPQAGDRIIALANSSEAEVFNGQQFDVLAADASPSRDDQLVLHVADDEGQERSLRCWAAGFKDLEGEKQAKRDGRGAVVAATFAQAVTTHKAQGSQWDRVLVVDEASVFYQAAARAHEKTFGAEGARIEGHINGQRWLYTAITRAAQRVVIVPAIAGLLA